ncbi:MAG TPA: R3H domain-containing nucleic acid-binding protein [Negativicutes bacterium]|nr:R3H domain-containing nucleic acid-binding protein [Negativicutes bacterium]
MIPEEELGKIKALVKEFLETMTVPVLDLQVKEVSPDEKKASGGLTSADLREAILVELTTAEAQVLIGQNGQTLVDMQRLLRMMANKALQKNIHLSLDINGYTRKKMEYLSGLAKNVANEVFLTRQKKILPPMPAYERRIIHAELAGRQDVISESQGEGEDRRVVVNPVE